MTRPDRTVVELTIEDPRWDSVLLERVAQRAVSQTLGHLGLTASDFAVSILACADAKIADLNSGFREKPGPTNVLSWPSRERASSIPGSAPTLPDPADPIDADLGDIAISYDTVQREAAASGISFEHHTVHLITHAALHLLGYDHISEKDAGLMEGIEVEILADLDVANPYEVIVV